MEVAGDSLEVRLLRAIPRGYLLIGLVSHNPSLPSGPNRRACVSEERKRNLQISMICGEETVMTDRKQHPEWHHYLSTPLQMSQSH